MGKPIIWLEDLYQFCLEQQLYSYSSDVDNKSIIVSIPATYKAKKMYSDDEDDRFMTIHLKACHTLENLNKSFISEDVMNIALPTFHNCPILASIVEQTNSDGSITYDFNGHDMSIIDDPFNKGEKRINYIERIVGIIPSDSKLSLESDEDSDKKYVHTDGLIYTEHGNLASEILKNREEVSCSVELAINKFSFNAKTNILNIEDFKFLGVTLLGKDVKPGMAGSTVYTNFTKTNMQNQKEQMVELLDKLNIALTNFNILNSKEGGNSLTLFDQLLKQYGKKLEDITFKYEGLTDRELKEQFAALFDDGSDSGTDSNGSDGSDSGTDSNGSDGSDSGTDSNGSDGNGTDGSDGGTTTTTPSTDDTDDDDLVGTDTISSTTSNKDKKKYSLDNNSNMQIMFEISHEDVRNALYRLIDAYDELDNDWYYIRSVYDNYFVMEGYCSGKLFGQTYARNGDNVELTNERYELFEELLTASEKAELDTMRSNYSMLKQKVDSYELAKFRAEKEELLKNEVYEQLQNTPEYQMLVSDMDNYSVNELSDKLDLTLAKFVKEQGSFSLKSDSSKKSSKLLFGSAKNVKPQKNSFLEGLLKK